MSKLILSNFYSYQVSKWADFTHLLFQVPFLTINIYFQKKADIHDDCATKACTELHSLSSEIHCFWPTPYAQRRRPTTKLRLITLLKLFQSLLSSWVWSRENLHSTVEVTRISSDYLREFIFSLVQFFKSELTEELDPSYFRSLKHLNSLSGYTFKMQATADKYGNIRVNENSVCGLCGTSNRNLLRSPNS